TYCLLILSSYLFSRHVDHLHLHSFPTRRSSDLKESRSCVTSAVESADCAFLEIPIFPSCSSNTLEEIPNCFASVYTRVFSASCCLSICPANAAAPVSCSFSFSSAVAIGHAPVIGR